METLEIDLFSLNVRGITSINCFEAILDIIYRRQFSQNIVIQMQETKLNKLSQDNIDEINLRRLPYIDIPAMDSAGGLLTLWPKDMIVRQIFTESKIIGILLLDRGTLKIFKYMDQKNFDEEVSVLGNFLKNKTAEETDSILSGDVNRFAGDHEKHEKKEICDLRQKINEMEQKKMIRKLDRLKNSSRY